MEAGAESASARHDGQSLLAQVSNEMVGLYKELFGRGPVKARSDFAGPDVLICSLEETFTQAEKNMAAIGEHTRLRDARTFLQYASQQEFCGVIESLTGRKIRGFVSGVDAETDIAAEVFYFEAVP